VLVDANILIYARDRSSPFHAPCRDWLERALNGPSRTGLPWDSLGAFLRLSTHPRAAERPLEPGAAWDQVETWLAAPSAWIPTPTDRHAEVLGGLVLNHRLSGNLVPDAHLAALALCHGVGLCSADSDFARFVGLRWVNPLAER